MEAAVDLEPESTATTAQAADLLGVSRSTVTRLVQDGKLKAYKLNPSAVNSPLRIYRTSVDRLLQQRQKRQTPEKEAAARAGTAA